MTVFGMDLSVAVLLQGIVVGIPYGLLAVGLVLIYKVSKFINFAQGALGAFGGALVGTLVVQYGVPYWIAFVVGLLVAAGIAAAVEATIVRRLEGQPRLLGVGVTLLLSQFLLAAGFAINSDAQLGSQYPQPAGFPSFTVAGLVVTPPYAALLILSPLLVLGLLVLLRRTSFGLAIRATASNPDAAYSLGISPSVVAGRTWALAGGIAAFAAILLWPTQGFGALVILGPSLMLRGLVAAAVARFESVTVAFLAGVAIGVVDTVVRTANATSGAIDLILMAVALVVLMVLPPSSGRESDDDGDWTALALPRIPEPFLRFFAVRHFGTLAGALVVAIAALWVPRFLDSSSSFALTATLSFAIVGLSVLVLTGRAGQLSLGQFAVAGAGAVASVKVVAATGVFVLGPLAAVVTAAAVSVVIGLPSLRARGFVVAIVSLAFALAGRSWLLPQEWALGSGRETVQPVIGPFRLDDSALYYQLALGMLVLAVIATRWIIGSQLGRDWVAIRDNEKSAQALGVPVKRRKLQAFAVAGGIAGLGGSLLAHSQQLVTPEQFPATASIEVVVLAIVGGLAVTTGPVIGALVVVGLPLIAGLGVVPTAILQLLFLLLVVMRSGGLVAVLSPIRDWLVEEYVRLRGVDPTPVRDAPRVMPKSTTVSPSQLPAAPHRGGLANDPALELIDIARSFGGIQAVRGVNVVVNAGESVALIGPNGAGKTTLFEIASGFVRPDSGQTRLRGRNVTSITPQGRARRGLVRSFQNAALFPTLTVEETLAVAHRRTKTGTDPAVVLEALGLTDYRRETIASLPTGLRRLTELGCDLVLGPDVLLLDEPSAGIAHSEIPALAELLRYVNNELGVTMIVIDHDMTLLRAVCDRFVALDLGAVIAEGTADVVQSDPRVIEAFLGSSDTSERSRPVAVTS